MGKPISPYILSEIETARGLRLLRRSFLGHIDFTPAAVDALVKAVFPFAMEWWAALAPMERLGNGRLALIVPVAARCWPDGAENTTEMRFEPSLAGDVVLVDALTGAWEDANAASPGFAYLASAAARIWRRPEHLCGPQEAAERLLALIGLAILLERLAERGHPIANDESVIPSLETSNAD